MVRPLVLFGAFAALLCAADPRDIIRKAVEMDERNAPLAAHYNFLQRELVREFDHAGKVKSERTETFNVISVGGSPYKRSVAHNDQPLSPAADRAEEEKIREVAEERRHETAEQREKRIEEWRKHQERYHEPLHELANAFNFTVAGEETRDGRATYRIEGTPRPDYKPKSTYTAFFPKVKLRAWIDKTDFQASRIEIEAFDTISFGGFLVRLEKGSQIVIEQTRMGDSLWLPSRVSITAAARLLLVKNWNREMDYSFSEFRKIQPDSSLVLLHPIGR
ncbi:MAG: hypothetical protein JO099_17685 [Acidobacteriia bacterium]|nr:hypothetical protein [Terriglobia bacterium]